MRAYHTLLEMLERAVEHAKKAEPRLSNRRAAALRYVVLEVKYLRGQKRYGEALAAIMLCSMMREASSLTSLIDVLRKAVEAYETGPNPRTSNTGVNSGIASKDNGSVKTSAEAGLSEYDKASIEDFIAGK